MAEQTTNSNKGFSRVFSKSVTRTKEKVLHSLGKADRTQDELFDDHVTNFHRQQTTAQKLQKELKNYSNCLKTMQNATNNFYGVIKETYEPEWPGYTEIVAAIQQLQTLWEDFLHRLGTEVSDPLTIYLGDFPELKAKIAKRGRKLVDFDSARHNLESLEQAKKRDEVKVTKAKTELQSAEQVYNQLNHELHDSLPQMYEKRVSVLASNFSNLFAVESKFLEEASKVQLDMQAVSERLQSESHGQPRGFLSTPQYKTTSAFRNGDMDASADAIDLSRYDTPTATTPISKLPVEQSPPRENKRRSNQRGGRSSHSASDASKSSKGSTPSRKQKKSEEIVQKNHQESEASSEEDGPPVPTKNASLAHAEDIDDPSYETVQIVQKMKQSSNSAETKPVSSCPEVDIQMLAAQLRVVEEIPVKPPDRNSLEKKPVDAAPSPFDDDDDENEYDVAHGQDIYKVPTSEPVNGVGIPLGANVLYKVKATHPYEGDDTDELSFDVGEIIAVLPFPEDEDQDDGWLYGLKETDATRGVFPANFTKRL